MFLDALLEIGDALDILEDDYEFPSLTAKLNSKLNKIAEELRKNENTNNT